MFKKIIVPLDGSDLAEAVLPAVRQLAECYDAHIVALRVVVPPLLNYAAMRGDVTWYDEAIHLSTVEAEAYIHRATERLQAQGLKATARLSHELGVADAILSYAEGNGIDLIAMSTHGRSGIGRWLLGSVADRVVHGAKVPVLLVRPDLSKPM